MNSGGALQENPASVGKDDSAEGMFRWPDEIFQDCANSAVTSSKIRLANSQSGADRPNPGKVGPSGHSIQPRLRVQIAASSL
jgi:hypothetical protein